MIDWVKRMIERCMKRRENGVCDTCHLRKVCIHKAMPMKALSNGDASDGAATLKSLLGAFFETSERRNSLPVARKVKERSKHGSNGAMPRLTPSPPRSA